MVGLGTDTLTGGQGSDCFIIDVPVFPQDADDSAKRSVIRATKDSISDYEDEEEIVISNSNGTVTIGTNETAKDPSILERTIIVRKGAVAVVTTAYEAAVEDNLGTADIDEAMRAVPQQLETLVTAPGLTETRLASVTAGAGCAN